MQLILTNSGTGPCLLKGFAGVSLTADANGDPIGAPAARDDPPPSPTSCSRRARPAPQRCATPRPATTPTAPVVPAAGFRVYPPEDTASLFLAQPRDACSNAGINLLTIGAFQAK